MGLAVANNLKADYELIGGAIKREKYLICRPEKFFIPKPLNAVFRFTNPASDMAGFTEDLIAACRRYQADALIATGNEITVGVSRIKQEIMRHTKTRVLVEDYEKLGPLADKWNCYEICRGIGVPVPRTVLVKEGVPDETADLQFPVVMKPTQSTAAIGFKFFQSRDDLKSYLETHRRDAEKQPPAKNRFVIQEFIDGELHDVTCCAKNGAVASMLTQKRLMTLYDFGGGGIANKTTRIPEIMDYAERILKHMKWNGVAEFDFIRDQKGAFYLLECNPRFWGTVHLTISAGLNVAQQLVNLLLLDEPVPPRADYEVGLAYKWLFPDIVYHWFVKPRSFFRIMRRIRNTFRRYGAARTIHNLKPRDLMYIMAIVMDGKNN